MADELWLFGEWEKSEGCLMERNVALAEFVAIRVVRGWIGDRPIFDDAPKWLTEKTPTGTSGDLNVKIEEEQK